MTEYQHRDQGSSSEYVVVRPRRERVMTSPGEHVVLSPGRHSATESDTAVRGERKPEPDPVLISTLKDMAVVSLADGAKVGTIKEVFFDTRHQRVVAFVLASDVGEFLLSFDAVRNIGPDALTVDTAGTTHDLRRLADLTELKAVNVDGTLLGEVKELEIDRNDGRLTELVVHRGGVLGLGGTQQNVPASAVRSIGPAVAMVDMPAAFGG